MAVIDDMIELVSDERFSKSGNVSDQQLLSSLVTSWLPDIVSSVATNTRYLSSRGAARRKSEENMSEIEAQLDAVSDTVDKMRTNLLDAIDDDVDTAAEFLRQRIAETGTDLGI